MQAQTAHAACGAKTRSGAPCKNVPVRGRTRCRMHGGKSVRGVESGTFKTGAHSKYMPKNMLGNYKEHLDNPDLLSNRNGIALMDVLIDELLPTIDTGESGKAWQEMKDWLYRLQRAWNNLDEASGNEAIENMKILADSEITRFKAIDEVRKTADQRRKLVDTERKYSEDFRRHTDEAFLIIIHQLIGVIDRVVTSPDDKKRLAHELGIIISSAA